jgi:uncharacterized protein (TIGR02284 family)
VQNPGLKKFFSELAVERAEFASELRQKVVELGGEPETKGSVAGALHRGWMNIIGTLTSKDEHAILSECERGEDSAVEAYRDALKADLPADAGSGNALASLLADKERGAQLLVNMQFERIQQAHARIKQLRDAKSATTSR